MSDTPPRPSHTTMAAGLIIGGSVGVVLVVAQQLSGLHSLETRETVAQFLGEPPGSGLGLDVPGALRLLRVALMVVAGCATAAAVLGYHVLKGSHRARVGLSLLAPPIFVGGLATGGFLTSLVAAASVLLWVGPSAAWFRGESPTQHPQRRRAPEPWPPPRPDRAGPGGASGAPDRDVPTAGPREWPPPPAAAPARRPDALVWACVLTWAFCSLVLVVLLASAVLMATNPDLLLDELRRQGRDISAVDADLLQATTFVTAGLTGVWTLGAVVLAVLAYRGSGWARLSLVVSASAAAVLCLVASISTLLALVPGVACLATVLLLTRPGVRAWSGRASRRRDAMHP